MPKMFMRVKDSKTNKVYYFQWSTMSDAPFGDAVDTDGFVELHHQIHGGKFTGRDHWAVLFSTDMIQLGKTNVSNPDFKRAELLSCSDDYKTVKSLVEYCKTNFVKL